jgi:hypothetical protein
MRARHAVTFASAAAGGLACIVHISCGTSSHLYTGRFFSESRGCLGTESSIDVVEDETPGSCAPVCLVRAKDPNADGGRSVYVSTMCSPYPKGFDTSGADPACARALDALSRNDTCLSDGGSTHPAPSDAGAGG